MAEAFIGHTQTRGFRKFPGTRNGHLDANYGGGDRTTRLLPGISIESGAGQDNRYCARKGRAHTTLQEQPRPERIQRNDGRHNQGKFTQPGYLNNNGVEPLGTGEVRNDPGGGERKMCPQSDEQSPEYNDQQQLRDHLPDAKLTRQ